MEPYELNEQILKTINLVCETYFLTYGEFPDKVDVALDAYVHMAATQASKWSSVSFLRYVQNNNLKSIIGAGHLTLMVNGVAMPPLPPEPSIALERARTSTTEEVIAFGDILPMPIPIVF
jgi:hypothetical protein